jgi:hypothetical protein
MLIAWGGPSPQVDVGRIDLLAGGGPMNLELVGEADILNV